MNNLKRAYKREQLTSHWFKTRNITIPSSLVKKAMKCTDSFLSQYDVLNDKDALHWL